MAPCHFYTPPTDLACPRLPNQTKWPWCNQLPQSVARSHSLSYSLTWYAPDQPSDLSLHPYIQVGEETSGGFYLHKNYRSRCNSLIASLFYSLNLDSMQMCISIRISTEEVDNFEPIISNKEDDCFMWNTYQQVYALNWYLLTCKSTFLYQIRVTHNQLINMWLTFTEILT